MSARLTRKERDALIKAAINLLAGGEGEWEAANVDPVALESAVDKLIQRDSYDDDKKGNDPARKSRNADRP